MFAILLSLPFDSYSNPSLKWAIPYSTNGIVFSSPSIADDGTVYIGSNDNKLHAINSDGTAKWTFSTGDWVDSTPAIGPNGTVYVGSWDNQIYAINPSDGTKLWDFNTSSSVIASPSIGVDGKIYFGSKDDFFYALESNGSLAWEVYIGNPVSSSAALGQDGTIYFGDENGTFHALNQDGTTKWTYLVDEVADANKSILSSPAVDIVGNIFFGCGNGYCYSISDNGSSASLVWKYQTGDRVDASPVLGTSNEVFFVSRDGYLRSIDTSTGIINWEVFCGDVFYSSPVVDSNGRVYVVGYTGFGENHLFAFDANGSLAWDTNSTSSPLSIGGLVDSSLALDQNGTLFFGCFDNKVYAVNVGTGLADSPWPQFKRGGNRNGSWPSFLVEVGLSPSGAGEVNGSGIYNQGATATLSVSSNINDGYSFGYWSGDQAGSSNPLTFGVNSHLNITANFHLNAYLLEVNSSIGGTATGSTNLPHGSLAPIIASANPGYSFTGWTGDGITDASAQSTTISMTQARTATANFSPNLYTINIDVLPVGAGAVDGGGDYNHGDSVSLQVTPDASQGYNFVNWSGSSVGSDNPLNFQIYSDLNLTANFALNVYLLTVNAGTGGTASGSTSSVHGSLAQINASPSSGYSFAGWIGEGISDQSSEVTTVNMTKTQTVTASFSLNSYPLTLPVDEGGRVSGEGNFTHGTSAPILAVPNNGYYFTGWTGNGITNPASASTTVLMNQPQTITANFQLNSYALTLNSSTGGSVSGDGNFTHGSNASIVATPAEGYSFMEWSGNGITDSTSAVTTVSMTEPRSVSVTFSLNSYNLNIISEGNGTAIGEGIFSYNSLAPINAFPQSGYVFLNWSGTGISEHNQSSTTVLMNQDRNVTVRFGEKAISSNYLFVSSNPSNGGTTSGAGSYSLEENASISASPLPGYSFSSWVGGGVESPLSRETNIIMNQDHNISAIFNQNSYNLFLISGSGGSISGSGSYLHGTNAIISASPSEGYLFNGWKGNGVSSPSSLITTVNMTETRYISALFAKKSFVLNINQTAGGTATGAGTYNFGSSSSISASPFEGYSFSSWIGNGIANSLSSNSTVTMNQDRNISALFLINSYDLIINAGTGGSVLGAGSYTFGSTPLITASPLEGYSFTSWTGTGINNSLSPSTFVTMNQDQNVTALFSRIMLSSKILAVGREHNWYESTWFGSFYESASGWCYHSDLGWIYPYFSENSFWIWSPHLKWLWISSSTYANSFTWSENEKNWIYLDFENSFGPRIYSYGKNAWQGFTIE